jgi:hypothetical protein
MVYIATGVLVLIAFLGWALYRMSVTQGKRKREIYIGFILVVVFLVVVYFLLYV